MFCYTEEADISEAPGGATVFQHISGRVRGQMGEEDSL